MVITVIHVPGEEKGPVRGSLEAWHHVCNLVDSVAVCVLHWWFHFVAFWRRKLQNHPAFSSFLLNLARSYCFLFSSSKECTFCLLCFPLLFLHGTLELQGVRIRSGTRRGGKVTVAACSCLSLVLKRNRQIAYVWKMTSVVSQACQARARRCKPAAEECPGSLSELTEFNFPHVKMTGLLIQVLWLWGVWEFILLSKQFLKNVKPVLLKNKLHWYIPLSITLCSTIKGKWDRFSDAENHPTS